MSHAGELAPAGETAQASMLTQLETAGPLLIWVVVLGFVFVECAFLVGLFLPGDSLLITAGVVLAANAGSQQAWALAAVATAVAIVGNQVGYRIGRRAGGRVMTRSGGRVLTRRNVLRATALMQRHGFWAVVLARWIPWVRTLAPMLAGAAQMDARRFTLASAIGAVAWVPTLVLLGFYGAGFLDRVPWLLPTAITVLSALVVIGTIVGLIRYRQELKKPVEEDAVGVPSLPGHDYL